MTERQTAPYGSWRSPIEAQLVAGSGVTLNQVAWDGDDLYWLEGRPAEGGRQVIVRRSADGTISDVTTAAFNVRSRVHEYGGGAYAVAGGRVYFSNFVDGRLYRQDRGGEPRPITLEGDLRYADLVVDGRRGRLICVREDHGDRNREAVNTLVAVDLEGRGGGRVLAEGNDFYANPRLSPDGGQMSWLTWSHPNLPWDGTELWVGRFAGDGSIAQPRLAAGGPEESIFDPKWSPDGTLFFVSDRSGWWNLFREVDGRQEHLAPMAAEFGAPQWQFGTSTFGFADAGRAVCRVVKAGQSRLLGVDLSGCAVSEIHVPSTVINPSLEVNGRLVAYLGGSATQPAAVLLLDLSTGMVEVVRASRLLDLDAGYVSVPETIEFPTAGGLTAHGLFYATANRDYAGPAGERPPLLVHSHGGPTSASTPLLSLETQFWTSRGIAVLDVNYGGSTGYGREYRRRLEGQWGVIDVDDCINGARYLARRGDVDAERLIIAGGSAGGYTTLCALTFRDAFRAGASHYGIGDLEVFVHDTHKFESRYLDRLVGSFPERRDLYHERSAINYTDRLSCPVILFQGLDDKIVPPNQAELMAEALRRKGLPVAHIAFAGEGHGFRKAENIARTLEAELYFYSRVFGFALAEPVEPVVIENLGR